MVGGSDLQICLTGTRSLSILATSYFRTARVLSTLRNSKLAAIRRQATIVGLVALSQSAWSATYFLSANATKPGNGTANAPFLTMQRANRALSPGDTLVIRDGTYTGRANMLSELPSGLPGQYILYRAENEGKVILSGGLSMSGQNRYLIFQGLRFHDVSQKQILGSHLKFFRNEFRGAPLTGNVVTVAIGTNDFTPGAQFVLMEDNWIHGEGGRYKLLVYNSDSIVLRRNVTRFDGFTSTDNAPQADVALYDSSNIEVQNSIVLESVHGAASSQYVAAFYNVCNRTTTMRNVNHFWRGIIAINPRGYLMGTEGQCATVDQTVEDAVLFGGSYGISQLKGTNIMYSRCTIVATSGDGFGIFGGTATVRDSVVYGAGGKAFNGITPTSSVAFANAGGNVGGTIMDPRKNGLLYLPRIEAGSALSVGGTGGGQRGARIVKRIGESGTLYGETGYATTTASDLWPYPNEARIKKEMCEDAKVSRGFCATSESLTKYIFSILSTGERVR